MALLLCAALPAMLPVALAEDLPDPTAPPAGMKPGRPVVSSLQSILISPSRRGAIIDGQMLELGEKRGGVRLIEVNPGSVVLDTVEGRQVLSLFPDIKIEKETRSFMENRAKNPIPRPRAERGDK